MRQGSREALLAGAGSRRSKGEDMFLINALASAVLSILALSDLRRRRLPNAIVASFAALYFVHAWLGGETRTGLEAHLASGALALALAALLFRFGWLGGGDAKLFAAVFLWAGPAYAASVFFIVSFAGLLLAMVQLGMARTGRAHAADAKVSWLAPARGVPYGVALAIGGLAAVWAPLTLTPAAPLQHAAWQPLSIHARLI
jgi:prepilin peptidase CpaA